MSINLTTAAQAIITSVDTSIFEVRGAIAVSCSLHPVSGVIDSVKLVIGEEVDGALTMRNGGAGKQSTPTNCAFVQARVQVISGEKNLQYVKRIIS